MTEEAAVEQAVEPEASATPPDGEAEYRGEKPVADMTLEEQVTYWREHSRNHQQRAKAAFASQKISPKRISELEEAERELTKLRDSQLPDTERVVKEAEQRARQSALGEFGQKLAAAEIRAALTGVIADPSGVIEDLNLAKFVTESGDVDSDAVMALREKYAGLAPQQKPAPPALHQGRQGSTPSRDFDAEIKAASSRGDHVSVIALKRAKADSAKTT